MIRQVRADGTAIGIRPTRRTIIAAGAWASAGTVAVGLAACGANGATTGGATVGSPSAPAVTVGLLVKTRSSTAAEEVLRQLFKDQNQQNPKSQVEVELVAADAVLTQLTSRAAAGTPQDFVESGGFAWVGMA